MGEFDIVKVGDRHGTIVYVHSDGQHVEVELAGGEVRTCARGELTGILDLSALPSDERQDGGREIVKDIAL